MSSSKYGSTPNPDWHQFRKKFNADYFAKALNVDQETTLFIQSRYVCLYDSNEQKLDIDYIRAAHDVLNTAFRMENTLEIAQIPNNTRYPFRDLVGNPNIQFLPIDSSELEVQYIQINSSTLSNSTPVDDAASRAGRTDDVMNIYIGNTTSQILGQAELGGNVAFCLYTTMGGPDNLGQLSGYDLSKTLVHEIGHALNLPHIFSDDSCDNVKLHPDIPEQTQPNFNASIFLDTNGEPDGRNDHRYTDRANNSSSSCLHVQSDVSGAPNEMFMNYMDYGDDYTSLMFSQAQVLMMREYLTSSSNTTLKVYDSEGNAPEFINGADEVSLLDDAENTASMTTIAIIIVAVIVFILIIGAIVVFKQKQKKSHKSLNLKSMVNYESVQIE
jgi:hypothetical protein